MRIKPLFALLRIRIAALAALSAALGHALYQVGQVGPSVGAVLCGLGVFLLAGGASALNQFMERSLDALMERTAMRPIPTGRISPEAALFISASLISSGLFALLLGNGTSAAHLGLFALFWYLVVYTPLKRETAYAFLPGVLVGALPPVIGWAFAGGSPLETRILFVALLYAVWQVPHCLLIVLRHEDDFRRAGFPTLAGRVSRPQLRRVTASWICATAILPLMLPLFIHGIPAAAFAALFLGAMWMLSSALRLCLDRSIPLPTVTAHIVLTSLAVFLSTFGRF